MKLAQILSEPVSFSSSDGPFSDAGESYGFLDLPKDASIFEHGVGTGVMGKYLSPKGYNRIEGADATAHFVKHCNESGWYERCYEMFLGLPRGPDNAPTIPDHLQNRFDCVMGTGVYYEGHIPKEGFLDAYDMLKIGGHFCFGIRKYYWVDGEKFGYKDAMESLI